MSPRTKRGMKIVTRSMGWCCLEAWVETSYPSEAAASTGIAAYKSPGRCKPWLLMDCPPRTLAVYHDNGRHIVEMSLPTAAHVGIGNPLHARFLAVRSG